MPTSADRLNKLNTPELEDLLQATLLELSTRAEPAAFEALLRASSSIGISLGESARLLAAGGSWSQVAQLSGTTKQAAWARWSSH
jgi:hypothetical protein